MIPIILISAAGIFTLLLGVMNMRKIALPMILFTLLIAISTSAISWNKDITPYFNDMFRIDNLAIVAMITLLFIVLLIFILSIKYYNKEIEHLTDIYGLLLFALVGAMLMVCYSNLNLLFLAIEILSIPLYVLAASHRTDNNSNEAGLKYFIMGAFASGFLLFGIALLFGQANTFSLDGILKYYNSIGSLNPQSQVAILLILVGFLFKIAAAPFHFWAPDVYQGAPSLITVFMSSIVKIAGIIALYRFVNSISIHPSLGMALTFIIILTLFIANFSALRQTSFKRFMAYSSIANTGFLLIPFISNAENIAVQLMFYLIVYAIANIGIFTVYMAVRENYKTEDMSTQFGGLFQKNKLLGTCLLLFLLSLAGIPPLSGFIGKYLIISTAINSHHIALGIFAILCSIIAVYYYIQLGNYALFHPNDNTTTITLSIPYKLVIILCAIMVIVIGIFPDYWISLV